MNLFKPKKERPITGNTLIQQRAIWFSQIEALQLQISGLRVKIRDSYDDRSLEGIQSPRDDNGRIPRGYEGK